MVLVIVIRSWHGPMLGQVGVRRYTKRHPSIQPQVTHVSEPIEKDFRGGAAPLGRPIRDPIDFDALPKFPAYLD